VQVAATVRSGRPDASVEAIRDGAQRVR